MAVTGHLSLAPGVLLSWGELGLAAADIPTLGNTVQRSLSFSNAQVLDPGVMAHNFAELDAEFSSKKDHLVPKSAQRVHIVGVLTLEEETSFSTDGTRVGVVGGAVNSRDIGDLFQHCAWASLPASVDSSDVGRAFTSDVEFTEARLVEMPSLALNINSVPFSEFVRLENPSGAGVYNVGGDKTFATIASLANVEAGSFNSKTLDQFINKDSNQSISGVATFNGDIAADVIIGEEEGSRPLVDHHNLTEYFTTDLDILPSTDEDTFYFATLHTAHLKVKDKVNDFHLPGRLANVIRTDESQVVLSGQKVFLLPVQADEVKVEVINTKYQVSSEFYHKSFNIEDFVNTRNPQKIAGGKLFSAAVTLGDSQFLGSGSAIITADTEPYLAAPLANCWLDLTADGEVDIMARVHFANLVTGGLAVSKTGKIS